MTTRDDGTGDTITGYHEFELDAVRRQSYRNAVARLVYPRISGFAVERLPGSRPGQGLVVLVVPGQEEAGRPYLVQGVVRDESVLGAHVLLPVRREDDVALMDAAGIHARLRLGEQVIEGRWRPLDPPRGFSATEGVRGKRRR
jgi:hypothetical protein